MEASEKCPWCGSVISHEKFIQIETQIREQERKKLEQAEAAIRQRLETESSQRVEAAKKDAAKQYEEKASKLSAQVAAEREKMAGQLAQIQAREAEARTQAQQAKESAETTKKNLEQRLEVERQAAQQRGKEEAQKEFATQEAEQKKFREQFRQLQVSESEARKQAQQAADSKSALERSFNERLEAEKLAAEKRSKQETEALLNKEMDRRMMIRQQEHEADLARQNSESQKRLAAVLKELDDAKRKVEEQKTSSQLGDGAEVNLYEDLLREFAVAGDRISRVLKGQSGPDIRHMVVYKGEVCGQIVYDSKKQQQWRKEWVSKLLQDQIDAKAQHAVLATTVFPSPNKELCIESGVVVVNPARTVYVSHLLRNAMIAMHIRGLSDREKAGKMKQIYEYMTSHEHKQKFDQVVNLNKAIQQVDVDEREAHLKVWNKRGALLKGQQHSLEEIEREVAAIVEAPTLESSSAA
jgi:hypothetical protein